jgi:hypothetical protein
MAIERGLSLREGKPMPHQRPRRDCSLIRWLWLDGDEILVCFTNTTLGRFTLKNADEAARIAAEIWDAESPKEAFEKLLQHRPFRAIPIC